MRAAYEHARKTPHHLMVASESLLTPPIAVGRYACATAVLPSIAVDTATRATRSGTIDALAGWFEATLAPGIAITNAPGAAPRLARRNLLLPVTEPITVAAGEEIRVSLRVLTRDQVCRWTIDCCDAGGIRRSFSGSTFEGALISREDLAGRQAAAL
jgi:hypothetical protein